MLPSGPIVTPRGAARFGLPPKLPSGAPVVGSNAKTFPLFRSVASRSVLNAARASAARPASATKAARAPLRKGDAVERLTPYLLVLGRALTPAGGRVGPPGSVP